MGQQTTGGRASELKLTPQAEDFAQWYQDIIAGAQLADRGPAKGTMVIRPYGYRIWELIQGSLDAMFKDTGHENAYFPLFIPESYIHREAEHIEGFSPELAVVTHAGGKKLEEPLVVRPTSETIIGEMMSRWVGSWRDLPLLLNQWANVVRWELRPRVFLRTTEFLWQEGHTAHVDEADAMEETIRMLDVYEQFARDWAAIPVVTGEKTPGERFAGAVRTYTIEGMMRDGKALQSGTSHYLGTNFAETFDIRYQNQDNEPTLCHTTSWGMSTRMIGGVIMAHGDDDGLVLPPRLAPYQAVVIPIGPGDKATMVAEAADALAAELADAGIRVHVDHRDERPGFKFNDWTLRGVPIRIEIGPRDIENDAVMVGWRIGAPHGANDRGKLQVSRQQIGERISTMLDELHNAVLARATAFRDERTVNADDWAAFATGVSTGFTHALHCGRSECEDDIKAETAATPRCIPREADAESGTCVRCGQPSAYGRRVVFARAY